MTLFGTWLNRRSIVSVLQIHKETNNYSHELLHTYVSTKTDCFQFVEPKVVTTRINPYTGENNYERTEIEKYALLPENAFAIGYNF